MSSFDKPRGRPKTTDAAMVQQMAMMAYWHKGPADVSVNAICAQAGVAKPSLYREYGSEDGLQCAALNRYADTVLADIFAILQQGGGARGVFDGLIEFACDDPRMERGCLFFKMRAGQARLGPMTRARVDQISAAAFGALQQVLAQSAGDLAIPAPLAAQYVFHQLGLGFALRASGINADDCRALLELAFAPVLRANAQACGSDQGQL